MLKVIDVSYSQGLIDWGVVKPHIDAAIIRCGYGSDYTDQDDVQWARNVSECERLGIPYGVYLYSYADNMAKAESEINHTLRLLKGHHPDFPVYLDEENRIVVNNCAAAYELWEKKISEAGYIPGLYSGYYFRKSYMPDVKPTTWWMAWYNSEDYVLSHLKTGWKYDGWQYSSKGSCPGIYSDGLDMDVFYKDFRKSAKPTVVKPVAVPKQTKCVVDGILGVRTIKAWQTYLGVTADGIIGRNTSKAIQKWSGATVDGIIGINTRIAVQRKLGVAVDGIWGKQTISALQRFLNAQ